LRFALSALTASFGLLLLGLAFFGQPGLYLHQVRQGWQTLVTPASADQDLESERVSLALQVGQLQQRVQQLQDQLSTSQAIGDQLRQQLAQQSALQQQAPLPRAQREEADPTSPAVTPLERHDVAKAAPLLVPPPASPSKPRSEASTSRVATEDAQSVLARLRQRSVAALPPDVPAAVERTRPLAPPPEVTNVVERPPPATRSPLRQRLAIAQAALANGRIDDARRVLQEVQLKLVFRPISPSGDDLPSAGQSASDVARALEALSSNDVAQGRHYIERAVTDMSGTESQSLSKEAAAPPSATGYAPAYPQR